MHGSLAGVLSDDSVYHDSLLSGGQTHQHCLFQYNISETQHSPFSEPALFASSPVSSLGWRWGHEHKSGNANEKGEQAFNQEEPSPTRLALNTSHVQNTVSEESRQDICDTHCGPEKAQSNG